MIKLPNRYLIVHIFNFNQIAIQCIENSMILVSIVLHLICLDYTKVLMNKHSLRELKVLGLIRSGFVDMHFLEIIDQNERFV